MTENTAEAGTTAEDTPDLPPANEGSGRWAIYDTTLRRYVDGVRDSKPTATEARKAVPEGHGHAIIEV